MYQPGTMLRSGNYVATAFLLQTAYASFQPVVLQDMRPANAWHTFLSMKHTSVMCTALQAGLHPEATKLALNLDTVKERSLALQLAIKYEQSDVQGKPLCSEPACCIQTCI